MDIMWYDVIWCDITSGSQPRHHQFGDDWYEIIWVANTCFVPQCHWLMLVNNASMYNQHHIIASTSTCWWVPCLKQFCQKFAFLIHDSCLSPLANVHGCHDVILFCQSQWKVPCIVTGTWQHGRVDSVQCLLKLLQPNLENGSDQKVFTHGFSAKQHQGSNHYINEEWGNPIGSPKLSDSPLVGYSNAALCAAKPSTLQGLRG